MMCIIFFVLLLLLSRFGHGKLEYVAKTAPWQVFLPKEFIAECGLSDTVGAV